MTHLVIEVIENHSQPSSRMITNKSGQQKEIWEQKVYIHNGGAFPVESRINVESLAKSYPVGKYFLNARSFQVGPYGDIEINRYEIDLVPVQQLAKKVAS